MKKVLVTGCAGFIGYHVTRNLLDLGETVIGIDNLNPYYDVTLKKDRLSYLKGARQDQAGAFDFFQLDLTDQPKIEALFKSQPIDRIIHLAAQAGVRHSLTHPHTYIENNITGTLNLLEACRRNKTAHLVYASSSSVYGASEKLPFSVKDPVDHPISLYGVTKKTTELMAHSYSHLFGIPTTGLRFFTVYGPWGRPDMALFKFTKAILEDKPIDVFNYGKMERDFTYIDDIVDGVLRTLKKIPDLNTHAKEASRASSPCAPYRLYNIGNHKPVNLLEFISVLEKALGKKAATHLLPMQPGDVSATFAKIDDLTHDTGFEPKTSIEEGIPRFVSWYKTYYRV